MYIILYMSGLVEDKDYLKYLKYKMKYQKLKAEIEGGAPLFFSKFPFISTSKPQSVINSSDKIIKDIIDEIEKNRKIYDKYIKKIGELLSKKKAEKREAKINYLISKGKDLLVKPIDDLTKDAGLNSDYLKHNEYTAKKTKLESDLELVKTQLAELNFDATLNTKAGNILSSFGGRISSSEFPDEPIITGTKIVDEAELGSTFDKIKLDTENCFRLFNKLKSPNVQLKCPPVPQLSSHLKLLAGIKQAKNITSSDLLRLNIDNDTIKELIKKRLEIYNSRLSTIVSPYRYIAEQIIAKINKEKEEEAEEKEINRAVRANEEEISKKKAEIKATQKPIAEAKAREKAKRKAELKAKKKAGTKSPKLEVALSEIETSKASSEEAPDASSEAVVSEIGLDAESDAETGIEAQIDAKDISIPNNSIKKSAQQLVEESRRKWEEQQLKEQQLKEQQLKEQI